MYNLKQIGPCTYILPQEEGMLVPGLIIASEELLRKMEIEKPLLQIQNVAHLPGIIGYSIAMPDIHWGYGFPIGGVAAMDTDCGVISPGGVGYDINCGVRLALAPQLFNTFSEATKNKLLQEIFNRVPSGVGQGHKGTSVTDHDYKKLLEQGARWSIRQGYGFEHDLEHIESNGCIEGADADAVSPLAKDRGRKQIGSVGSGNHFVEIGEIQKIFDPSIAEQWNLFEGQTYILIHSGSRGLGHQVCQDTLNDFMKKGLANHLPDPQLVSAPIKSEEGQKYFSAMATAANFAFNNRQQILHAIRQAFLSACHIDPSEIKLLYDVCHNIAKFETYTIEGKKKTLCVHRKGATRAFGPGSSELNPLFQKTGQPVLVPGDMGRASHLMVGLGNPLTWCSSCHGAGRALSRVQSLKNWKSHNPVEVMKEKGVQVKASSLKALAEEMPDAYKNVDEVVDAVQQAQLANKVARLRPYLVVKG